jgi:hypothetical protein
LNHLLLYTQAFAMGGKEGDPDLTIGTIGELTGKDRALHSFPPLDEVLDPIKERLKPLNRNRSLLPFHADSLRVKEILCL